MTIQDHIIYLQDRGAELGSHAVVGNVIGQILAETILLWRELKDES